MNELTKMAKKLNSKTDKPIPKSTASILNNLDKYGKVYLTGAGGSGKSFQIKRIQKLKPKTWTMATTGIASINVNGETYHSALGIDIISNLDELKLSDERNRHSKRFISMHDTLRDTEIVIIDEVSMMNSESLKMVLYRLSNYKKIKLLLVGDFPQLTVVTGRPLYKSKIFTNNFKILKLKTNWRQKEDVNLQKALYEVRNCKVSETTRLYLMGLKNTSGTRPLLIRSTNKQVDALNLQELNKIDAEFQHSYRSITYKNKNIDKYVLDGIIHNILEPETFSYKVGARVMVTSNDKILGVYNGDLGLIVSSEVKSISILLDRTGRRVSISRKSKSVTAKVSGKDTTVLEYVAHPLKIAFASTVHKCQGLTLISIDIDCDKMFNYSQFYTALSRAVTSDGITIHNLDAIDVPRKQFIPIKYYVP